MKIVTATTDDTENVAWFFVPSELYDRTQFVLVRWDAAASVHVVVGRYATSEQADVVWQTLSEDDHAMVLRPYKGKRKLAHQLSLEWPVGRSPSVHTIQQWQAWDDEINAVVTAHHARTGDVPTALHASSQTFARIMMVADHGRIEQDGGDDEGMRAPRIDSFGGGWYDLAFVVDERLAVGVLRVH